MKLIGSDFHTRFQAIAMVDTESGELEERRLNHEGKEVERFYGGSGGSDRGGDREHRVIDLVSRGDGQTGGTTASGRCGEDPERSRSARRRMTARMRA